MSRVIQVGTSGFSYKDWKGPFYPDDCRQGDMLSYYAGVFDTVELNFSYYRLPEPGQMDSMAETVGAVNPGFTFSIKAYRGMTHEITPEWTEQARLFRRAVGHLDEVGRLAAVLMQFPYSFHYTVQNRKHLDRLIGSLEGLPLACEFRNREWMQQRVTDGLSRRGVAMVAVDEPQLDGLLPPTVISTAPLGYVRFHGRNRENWWQGDNTSRYDYLYSGSELAEWVPKVESLAESTRRTVIYFNNHWRGQAAENAQQLRGMVVDTSATEGAP
ncbi:MAG: DUF72 domain-containing protein [Planctomycetota bacterium]